MRELKNMKIMLGIALISSIFTLSSCNISLLAPEEINPNTSISIKTTEDYSVPSPETKGNYKVTYVCNNGYAYQSTTTGQNKILEPEAPNKICSTFMGWYKDLEYKDLFDFSKPVDTDTILYAKWDTDLVSLTNIASTKCIKANVRIEITNYNKQGFGPLATMKDVSTSLGSGVIFYSDSTYYYALTNNHVVYTNTTYQSLKLEDAFEKEYDFNIVAKDNNYDLAIIQFRKQEDLEVISLADYDAYTNELVYAMGEPEGLSNTLSLGYILGSKVFTPDSSTLEKSNVTFNVYLNSAPIESGSSGGALLDSNLNLIGINFASAVDKDTNTFKYSYTIPSSRAREFVNKYLNIF